MKITLCLGSSCHARGNRVHVETLRSRLAARGVEAEIELRGSLCLGRCAEGPVVLVDGKMVTFDPEDDLAAML